MPNVVGAAKCEHGGREYASTALGCQRDSSQFYAPEPDPNGVYREAYEGSRDDALIGCPLIFARSSGRSPRGPLLLNIRPPAASRNVLEGIDRLTPGSAHVEVFHEVSLRAALLTDRAQ